LGGSQINRIYKSIARNAGLDETFIKGISGHSIRVGAAQDLLNSGASMPIIMQRGRWSKTDTVMRYVEHAAITNLVDYFLRAIKPARGLTINCFHWAKSQSSHLEFIPLLNDRLIYFL